MLRCLIDKKPTTIHIATEDLPPLLDAAAATAYVPCIPILFELGWDGKSHAAETMLTALRRCRRPQDFIIALLDAGVEVPDAANQRLIFINALRFAKSPADFFDRFIERFPLDFGGNVEEIFTEACAFSVRAVEYFVNLYQPNVSGRDFCNLLGLDVDVPFVKRVLEKCGPVNLDYMEGKALKIAATTAPACKALERTVFLLWRGLWQGGPLEHTSRGRQRSY